MARRVGLLLLEIASSILVLAGCSQLQQGRLAGRADPGRLAQVVEEKSTTQVAAKRSGNDPPPRMLPPPSPDAPAETRASIGTAEEEPGEVPVTPTLPKVTAAGPLRPEKAAPPLVEALRCMLEERHQDALRHLQSYDQETQEFFLRLLPTLALFTKKRLAELAPQEAAVLSEQLQGMLTSLRPRTELAIERMCFCKEFKSFGNYKTLPDDHAFVGTLGEWGELVQVYFELRNFSSEPRNELFETRLSSSVEIRDTQGNLKKRLSFADEGPLMSLTRLHDYGNSLSFSVPPELGPGTYELTLQIVDETIPEMSRVARKSLELRVTAAAAAAVR